MALLQVGKDDCRTMATQFLLGTISNLHAQYSVCVHIRLYMCIYIYADAATYLYMHNICNTYFVGCGAGPVVTMNGICLGRTIRPPHPGPPNHTYSTSPICKTHGSRTAFAVLELGALPKVPSSGGHTLNQMWWKGVPPKSKLPVSLEAGWLTTDLTGISDARSSQSMGTRLFVYSTPNAYLPKDDCEGGNGFDHWGGFVHYPGGPALGVYTVNKLRSVFLYKTLGSTEGMPERVEFYLAKLGKDYRKPRSVASTRHLVGYWPKSHFCQGFPKHEDLLLYTGLEVGPGVDFQEALGPSKNPPSQDSPQAAGDGVP